MGSGIVMAVVRLREGVSGWMELGDDRGPFISDSRLKVEHLVNEYFQDKLLGIPDAREFIEGLRNEQ